MTAAITTARMCGQRFLIKDRSWVGGDHAAESTAPSVNAR